MNRARLIWACGALLVATLHASPAAANTQDWSLREYVQTTWTHRNGLPLTPVTSLTQTLDGYLWFIVGRSDTLVRFDGVLFTTVPAPCAGMQEVESDPDGSLWVLCRSETYLLFQRQQTGRIVEIPLIGTSLRLGQPASLFVDSRQRLWIYGDIVARREADGSFREFGRLPATGSRAAGEDATGAVWFSDERTVIRVHDDRAESRSSVANTKVWGTPSGGLFASNADAIQRMTGWSMSLLVSAPNGVTFGGREAIDSTGAIWAITTQHGISRIQNGRFETSLSPGEAGSMASAVFVDREDNIWVASSAGLHRFRKPHARLLSSLGRPVPSQPLMVWVDSRDDLWVGNIRGVVRTDATTGESQSYAVALPSALAEDDQGRIWLGAEDHLFRLEAGTFQPVIDVAGAPVRGVCQMVLDANQHLWGVSEGVGVYQLTPGPPRLVLSVPESGADLLVSTQHGMWVALTQGHGIRRLQPDGTLTDHPLAVGPGLGGTMRIVERGDAIWIGHTQGLLRWRNGRWTTWSRAHGLPGRGAVQEIVGDHLGRLWLLSDGGLLAVSEAELDATPDGSPRSLRFVRIGDSDRVVVHPGNLSASPRAAVDRSGRLYFATRDSVAVVDPETVAESSLRPTIVIEAATADSQRVDVSTPGRLTAPSKLQFDYTSLSLRSPETIRFRYKLEGHDLDWIEADGTRQALYGTLPPGSYRFRVIGTGSEGVWNEEGASYAFAIVPLFYNTWWFRGLALVCVTAAIVAGHRLRVRRLTNRMQLQFEARLAERTRIAQDLHDTLLQGTLAASLHAQLADQALQRAPASAAIDAIRPPLRQTMDLLSQVARDSRAVLSGLRSDPSTGDIAQALHHAASAQPNHGDIDLRVTVNGTARQLKPAIAEDVIRIAREAVINAYQHAHARLIEVELVYATDSFQCIVRDDGQGVDAAVLECGREGHWGLAGMRERAERAGGELHLRSSATAGTEVQLLLTGSLAFDDRPVHRPPAL